MEDTLFLITEYGYQVLKENADFIQDKKYILYDNILIKKDDINQLGIFKGRLCVFTFDMDKIYTYLKMIDKAGGRL